MRMDSKMVEQARNTDMIFFFEKRHGFSFVQRGGMYRCHQHPSLAVKADRLSWYWHSKGIGGYGALDYLIKIERLSFCEAVEAAMQFPIAAPFSPEPTSHKQLTLPEKCESPQRILDYLCRRRGIDTAIVLALMDTGQIYQDKRGNVVFVGFDENETPRFASLRGTGNTSFRMDCSGSDKRYSFHMEGSQSVRLYIFESPIDAMSHATLENRIAGNADAWRWDSRLSLGGTSDAALAGYLDRHPHISELVLCLDNDPAGREAAVAIGRKYGAKGFHTRIELPQGKDYNDDLRKTIII